MDGVRLSVTVNIRDASTGELMLYQQGTFVQDTEPPSVLADDVHFSASGNLLVQFTASDAATSPIHGGIWFSVDDGATWDEASLDPTSDPLDEPSVQTFVGSLGPFSSGHPVLYFLSVQDEASNVTYFGLGTAAR